MILKQYFVIKNESKNKTDKNDCDGGRDGRSERYDNCSNNIVTKTIYLNNNNETSMRGGQKRRVRE